MTKEQIVDKLMTIFSQVENLTGPLTEAYIAGGAIASLVLGEEPKDYDVWFEGPWAYEAAVNNLKLAVGYGEIKSANLVESKYATSFELSDGTKIQLVQSRMGVPEQVVPGFDFKHTQSYMTRTGKLVADVDFIKSKVLVFVPGNFSHPVNTMQRVNKFARRGYDIPFETIRDLMVACTALDPETIGKSDKHAGSM